MCTILETCALRTAKGTNVNRTLTLDEVECLAHVLRTAVGLGDRTDEFSGLNFTVSHFHFLDAVEREVSSTN